MSASFEATRGGVTIVREGGIEAFAFGDLVGAAATRSPVPLVARVSREAFETAVGALARGQTIVALHPRTSDAEHAAIVARVTEHADDAAGAAVILATSGSTGTPKLCALTADALLASARASRQNIALDEGDRWLLAMPFAHAGGFSILTRCLEASASIVAVDGFDPALALRAIRDHGVTVASVVPTMLERLLEVDRADVLSRLRAVLVGGAACPIALFSRARARGVPALLTYGLTEAGSQVTTQYLMNLDHNTAHDAGPPLFGTTVSIVDDAGRDLGRGAEGRVVVRGPTLMRGYLGHAPIDGVLVTEDAGRLTPSGSLELLGRLDDLIITGGENVFPVEVERVLLGIAGVTGAIVAGVTDPRWGQVIGAVMTLADREAREAIEAIARRELPAFRVPRIWSVVDALPLLSNGKPDRRAARALLERARPPR